jgi:hypothetical protein
LTPDRVRRARALLVGLALAGSLWFGIVAVFVRLHTQHRLPAANVDSGLVDVSMLALNAVLLVSFVIVHLFRRSGGGDAGEASG